ncbi:MAG: O-antigen ligase family protein, partial [Rhodospirillales bacterium]
LFALGIILTDLAGVAASQSRSGFMVLLVVLGLIAWDHRHLITLKRLGLVIFFAGVVGGGVIVSLPDSFWARQATVFDSGGDDRSLGRRFSYVLVGRDAFFDSPLLGHGPGTFPDLYGRSSYAPQFVTKFDTELERYAHNTYIEVIVGAGLPGLIFFLALLARTLANMRQARDLYAAAGDEDAAGLSRAWSLATIGLMVFILMLSQLSLKYLWLVIAVSVLLLRFARERKGAS